MVKNKILIISYYFIPYKSVGAQRTTYWAQELAKYGYSVDVVTAFKGDGDNR